MSPDPLDIELAIATRREMSLGKKVGLRQLVAGEAGLTGKASIGLRAVKCRLGPGKLSIAEFLKFGLDKAPPSELPFFVGHHAQQKMHAACNERSSFDSSKNKLLWADILMKGGFDVPKTLAVYDRKGRNSSVPVLGDEKALRQFLANPSNLPVFCKPVTGTYSIGAFRIDEFDSNNVTINGSWKKPLGELVQYFEAVGKKGYLLQEPLKPNAQLAEITTGSIATLRVFLLFDRQTPTIIRAALKIPAGGEVADNFWRRSAELWAIDASNGNVIRRVANNAPALPPLVIDNPDTLPSPDFKVPDFNKALDLVKKAAHYFPSIRSQAWDIAITDRGPVLMELNFGGDLSLVQMAHGTGILREKPYCDHLRKCGYRGKLPTAP